MQPESLLSCLRTSVTGPFDKSNPQSSARFQISLSRAFLAHILKVLGSNLVLETGYFDKLFVIFLSIPRSVLILYLKVDHPIFNSCHPLRLLALQHRLKKWRLTQREKELDKFLNWITNTRTRLYRVCMLFV
jgi:hypothetical protein